MELGLGLRLGLGLGLGLGLRLGLGLGLGVSLGRVRGSLELEVALDLRQVVVQPLEAELVLVLEHLEELHVPVHAPPLHPRVARLHAVHLAA